MPVTRWERSEPTKQQALGAPGRMASWLGEVEAKGAKAASMGEVAGGCRLEKMRGKGGGALGSPCEVSLRL